MSKLEFKPQDRQSIDFAERERQKSKNLWAYGDVSGTQRVRIDLSKPLPIGTYTISAVANSNDTDASTCLVLFFDKDSNQLDGASLSRGVRSHETFDITTECTMVYFYASNGIVNGQGDTFSVVDIQIEEGKVATECQQYNGEIVRKGDTQIITSSLIADFTPTNYTDFQISPLVENMKIGNKLTMNSNGGIVIGTGIKKVLISVSTNLYVSEIGYHRLRVCKNGTCVGFKYEQTKDSVYRSINIDFTPFLLDVVEGDVITLQFQTTSLAALLAQDRRQTYMTVEVVE